MIQRKSKYIMILLLALLSFSCEYGRQAEQKLSDFNQKADELDKMVNEGIENVTDLDSILPESSKKLKEADSIIKDASATLDSLNQKVNKVQNIFN